MVVASLVALVPLIDVSGLVALLIVAAIQIEMAVFSFVLLGVIEMDIALERLWFAVTVIAIVTGRKADCY